MGKTVTKVVRRNNGILYPIKNNSKLYFKKGCDDLFVWFCTNKEALRTDGSIRVSAGIVFTDLDVLRIFMSIEKARHAKSICNAEDEPLLIKKNQVEVVKPMDIPHDIVTMNSAMKIKIHYFR